MMEPVQKNDRKQDREPRPNEERSPGARDENKEMRVGLTGGREDPGSHENGRASKESDDSVEDLHGSSAQTGPGGGGGMGTQASVTDRE